MAALESAIVTARPPGSNPFGQVPRQVENPTLADATRRPADPPAVDAPDLFASSCRSVETVDVRQRTLLPEPAAREGQRPPARGRPLRITTEPLTLPETRLLRLGKGAHRRGQDPRLIRVFVEVDAGAYAQ